MYEKINIKGINIAYKKNGEGNPLILLHGIVTYSFVWETVIPFLEKDYTIYSIDLLGCGNTDKSVEVDYSIKNQAELIAELIRSLGLEKVHLCAHDVGGGIAQILSVRHSELFCDITLINSVAYNYWPVQPVVAMRTPIIRQIAIATMDIGMLKLIVKHGLYHKEKLTDELFDKFLKQMNNKEGRKALLHFARCLNNNDLLEISDDLKNLDLPVQIILGEKDVYLNKETSYKLNENIPTSIFNSIKTAGHLVMIDEPEIVANLMKNFMEKNDG